MGEEWRRGWHPERMRPAKKKDTVLIVGAGPAGLDAALTLGRRGVPVILAEANRELGGRVTRETRLPTLGEWVRVRDWRVHQIGKLDTITVYRESPMTAADVRDTGAAHAVIATGATWRRNGLGRSSPVPLPSLDDPRTLTPDDIMAGKRPRGPVVVFDDDHYYMASVICMLLANEGLPVTYVTSDGIASSFSTHTVEQARTQAALIGAGVKIIVSHVLAGLTGDHLEIACAYSGNITSLDCGGLVTVTSREPNDALWQDLKDDTALRVSRIGDCKAPGIIAQAVYDGHRFAQEFDLTEQEATAKRERVVIT
jgi:dimethylamine/trimethylamine dehydrogenase